MLAFSIVFFVCVVVFAVLAAEGSDPPSLIEDPEEDESC